MQTVTRGGLPVAIEPKTFDVLRYLIDHRDRLVTKDELMEAVWKDVFVTPNVLTRAIAQLRKAIGDEAHDSRYIETVARRGYRFIAPVVSASTSASSLLTPDSSQTADRQRAKRIGGMSAGMIAVGTSIAIGVAVAMGAFSADDRPAPAASVQGPAIERVTSSGDVIDAVISPDGKYIAYVRSSGGMQSLWVRQTREANPLQIVPPAALGYWGLAFAPDSQSIFYAVKGQAPAADPAGVLYAVPVLPGPPPRRVLVGIDSTVTFSPDGRRIAYYRIEPGPPGTSTLIVSGADGSGGRVLATRTAPERFAPAFFAAPAWSPDNARIAVTVQNEHTQRTKLLLLDVDSGEETELQGSLASATFTAFLPDGSGVLFVGRALASWANGPQVWLQPLAGGIANVVADGAPRRVTVDTAEYRNVSVTRDGASILSVGTDFQASLWRVGAEGGGSVEKIPSMLGDGIGGTAWLGERLLFTGFESGEPQLWSMAADGTGRRQVTTDGWSAWPCVSPDGTTIYFIGFRNGQRGIWRMEAGGGSVGRLAEDWDAGPMQLSPDGRWLYYRTQAAGEDSTWRVSVDGGTPSLVVRGLGFPVVSPDGTSLAGIWRDSAQAQFELAVFSSDDGALLQKFPGFYTPDGGQRVQWSRDGKSLLFTTSERANIFRQRLTGGPQERVTGFADGMIFGFAPGPGGASLIVTRGPSLRDAFLLTGIR